MAYRDLVKLGLNVQEVMELTGLGRNKVLELIHSGKLKHVRADRRVIIPRARLEEYLEQESEVSE